MFSLYTDKKSYTPKNISVENYIEMIQNGTWQDPVIAARAVIDDKKKYTFVKSQAPVILGSCVMKPGKKEESNIDHLNGFIVLDIDEGITQDQYYAIKEDKYTHILHKSISGRNYCNFIKIDTAKDFKGIFDSLGEYYYNNFNITIDQSCSNKNRLRYVSWDEDLYHNPKSTTFRTVKKRKQPKKQEIQYIYTDSDFDHILTQIKDRNLDLCQDDYFRYVTIGMSLANEFGLNGKDKFHFICQFGSKYDFNRADKDYEGFCKRASGKSSIGTLYYLCKQEGIELYTEKTKTIINRVKTSKTQGNPTVESIKTTVELLGEKVTKYDEKLIQQLIDSNVDFSKNANYDLSEIEQLENFIVETYDPKIDTINNITYINENTRLNDREVNNIYLTCQKNFDFKISKNDIQSILNSSAAKEVDNLKLFLHENKSDPKGYIDKYISAINPQSEYNRWAFKKWIVGALHNWTARKEEVLVCPLTLVLSGQQHGTGKTSFLRNIMPHELRKYIAEAKINGADKDSMYTLCSSLLVFDDEFGGKAMKDVKEYKAISDVNIITQRRPYGRELETFKRRAILCGTTNEIDILKDVTGNRRILPISVESVDYDLITTIDTTQMIIEAYNLLKSGFDWMIRTEEDINYLNQNTEDNNMILPVEEMFFKFFSLERTENYGYESVWNQGDLLNFMLSKTKMNVTKYDIKEVIIKNKLVYSNYRNIDKSQKKGYKLYGKSSIFYNDNKINDDKNNEIPYDIEGELEF